jgi:hypothetical protein
MKKKHLLCIVISVISLTAISWYPQPPSQGTCCPQSGAICIVDQRYLMEYYALGGGRCPELFAAALSQE